MNVKAAKQLMLLVPTVLLCVAGVRAQQTTTNTAAVPNEPRVALTEAATAFDALGHEALGGHLRTTQLAGTQDAPLRNVLLVVENRSQFFYNYASGYATFYGSDGVRCGEGMWKTDALAPGEQVEVDTPGLRLTCTPTNWRLSALNLLTRTTDVAKPATSSTPAPPAAQTTTNATPTSSASAPQRLEININGKTLPLQLGNPIDVVVGKERVLIVVQPAP
jgi:hypothetical protein